MGAGVKSPVPLFKGVRMPFSEVLKLVNVAIGLIAEKQRTKFADEKMKIEREWYEEFNKPEHERSNLTLDLLWIRMRILSKNVIGAISAEP